MLLYRIIPVTPFQQNCSLLWCGHTKKAALVDPGGDVDRILAVVRELQVDVQQILLTHGHIDHVGGVGELVSRLDLPVSGPHREDRFLLETLDEQSRLFNFPTVQSFMPKYWLEQGDSVKIGESELSVYHCPGHSPGHIVFFDPQSRLAAVGDVLFKGSVGRWDLPRGNRDALLNSIKQSLWPLGDDVRFIPGHGAMSDFGTERRENPFVKD